MMTLPRLALPVVTALVASAALVHADPGAAVRRPVPAFHAIDASGSLDVEVSLGKQASVDVTADPDLAGQVITQVDHGVLTLRIESDGPRTVRATPRPRVVIVAPSLTAVSVGGTTSVNATGIVADRLELQVRGSGQITASGTTRVLNAGIRGSGQLTAKDLAAGDVTVAVTGSGHATARVSGVLDAVATGSGKIDLIGHPTRISSLVSVGDHAIQFH
jgi:hypothetical protein